MNIAEDLIMKITKFNDNNLHETFLKEFLQFVS